MPQGKKEKLDRTVLRSKLFVLFENTPRYTFKELNMRLNQPEEHLKSVSTCSFKCYILFLQAVCHCSLFVCSCNSAVVCCVTLW
jgi:TFIIF, beta subunit HTH domain